MNKKSDTLTHKNCLIYRHRLHYIQQGEGKQTIIFLHGWLNHSGLWRNSMQSIMKSNESTTCYALDLPGFGDSDAPIQQEYETIEGLVEIVVRFCEKLNITTCIFVGHSMGGMVSLQIAIKYSNLVDQLILISPAVTGFLGKPLNQISKWDTRLYALGLSLVKQSTFLSYQYMRAFCYQLNYADGWQETLQKMRQHSSIKQSRSLFYITQTDLTYQLKLIHAPVSVIIGKYDQTVPTSEIDVLGKYVTNMQRSTISNAAHMPMDENPEEFHYLLLKFLFT